jgi:hypothetical protein
MRATAVFSLNPMGLYPPRVTVYLLHTIWVCRPFVVYDRFSSTLARTKQSKGGVQRVDGIFTSNLAERVSHAPTRTQLNKNEA